MTTTIGKKSAWILWGAATICGTGFLSDLTFRAEDKSMLLPGKTTHGHYQIELDCRACHTPMMGVKQEACLDCHAADLETGLDSHPESTFTNPGNAHLLESIRADRCITCHREHQAETTRAIGVTLPNDYCAHCHQDVAVERPSHQGFGFQSCATTGCHRFHDNRGLNESYLARHMDEPAVLPDARVPERQRLGTKTPPEPDMPPEMTASPPLLRDWHDTMHAQQGVNCTDCHNDPAGQWVEQPGPTHCATCHAGEVEGWSMGRHGMRSARGLAPMTPGEARLPMKAEAAHRSLSCSSCHGGHRFDTRTAAVDACLDCHNDGHSRAYKRSKHFARWQAELSGELPEGSGVSCATCHLPRRVIKENGRTRIVVEHNQNANLRPRDKMIRSVCTHCHGMDFTLAALRDDALVANNYQGPSEALQLETMQWIRERAMEKAERLRRIEELEREERERGKTGAFEVEDF